MIHKNNPQKSSSDQSQTPKAKQHPSDSSRPHTDAYEAIERKNQGSKEKEKKGGTAKGKAKFDTPDDDPA